MRSAKRIVEMRFASAQMVLLVFAVVAALIFVRQTAATANQNSLTVVSAASYRGDVLAAEQIVVAFGSNLADAIALANTLPLPTVLSGVSVKVRDSQNVERLAPLFFVSPTQINFQIPAGTANGAASFTVVKNGVTVSTGNAPVATVAPSLFSADTSGRGLAAGQALRIKSNNAQSYEPIGQFDPQQGKFVPVQLDLGPATDQVFLIVYGSGFRNRGDLSLVTATIGGVSAEVIYAGAQGGYAGLDQLNIRIPRSLPGGEFDVAVTVEGKAANVVRLALKAPPLADVMYMASLRPEGSAFSPASGYATFRLSGDEKSGLLKFAYANLTTPETSAHIHGPADPGQNGGILFDLDTSPKQADGSFLWQFTNVGAMTVPQIIGAL
ncbi:MAG: CHRD domain-containing protein, partial [Acidobacteriota bacterium]